MAVLDRGVMAVWVCIACETSLGFRVWGLGFRLLAVLDRGVMAVWVCIACETSLGFRV